MSATLVAAGPVRASRLELLHRRLALGMGLAIVAALAEGRAPIRPALAALLQLGWAGLSLAAILLRVNHSWGAICFEGLIGLAFALLLASTVLGGAEAVWRKMLTHPLLQFLGLISFSMYLWHESITWVLFRRKS